MGRRWWVRLVLFGWLAALGTGCGGASDDEASVAVFAAASLGDAFTEMAMAYQDLNPGVDVQLNFAGSSSLREQILDGAPADVFASANQATMSEIIAAGAGAHTPRVFARNLLQVAVPAGNPAAITGLEDFGDPDLVLGICAEGVPCGDLANEALAAAGVDAAPDTLEPDVRALLAKIDAGELDAGIVYATDVLAAGNRVEGIDIPAAAARTASYPIVTLSDASNADGASSFVAFVLSESGQMILADHGFLAP